MGMPETMNHAPHAAALVMRRVGIFGVIAVLVMSPVESHPLE
jgi:hypothetical protein